MFPVSLTNDPARRALTLEVLATWASNDADVQRAHADAVSDRATRSFAEVATRLGEPAPAASTTHS